MRLREILSGKKEDGLQSDESEIGRNRRALSALGRAAGSTTPGSGPSPVERLNTHVALDFLGIGFGDVGAQQSDQETGNQ